MDSVASWLGLVGGVVGIIVFLGATAVYLKGSKDKGTITTLEASNRALTERVGVLEANEVRLTARLSALERENTALLSQRPSAEAIAKIDVALGTHDSETRRLLEAIVANVQKEGS